MTTRQAAFHERGIIAILLAPLRWTGMSILILIGLLLAAWIMDWVFVLRVWPDGITRLQLLLEQDVDRTYALHCWCGDLPALSQWVANGLYEVMFRASGLHEMGFTFAQQGALSMPDTLIRDFYSRYFKEIQVAMIATQRVGVRLASLLAGVPLVVMLYAVAMTDGLVQRAIRRAGGGHESAGLYHRTKYSQWIVVAAALFIYLLVPVAVADDLYALCLAVIVILVAMQYRYYKKHL